MKIQRTPLLALLLTVGTATADSVDVYAMIYQPGRPYASDTLYESAEDRTWIDRAITQDLLLLRLVPSLKYQITGFTDGEECSGVACQELALRRAELFQAELIRAGAPSTRFCKPKAQVTPWPSTVRPTSEEKVLGRRATVDPIFDGCA